MGVLAKCYDDQNNPVIGYACTQAVSCHLNPSIWERSCSYDSFRGMTKEDNIRSNAMFESRYWTITVKTAQGTSYTVDVDYSLRPQIGQTWP